MKNHPNLKILQINGSFDKDLKHEHLYRVCKEFNILIVISRTYIKCASQPSNPLNERNTNNHYHTNQESLENSFHQMDEEFYLKYLNMKRKHEVMVSAN